MSFIDKLDAVFVKSTQSKMQSDNTLSWADAARELLWPHRCCGCESPQELLCKSCREKLPWIAQHSACPCCGAPHGWMNCTECDGLWPMRTTICAWSHQGVAARAIRIYKDGGERDLAKLLATALEVALFEAASWPALDGQARFCASAIDGICFVPATAQAWARRGQDHMEGVARLLAAQLDIELVDAMIRVSTKDQRGLSKQQRKDNLKNSCHVLGEVSGMSLLLLDDVCTTGASLSACAEALYARGAHAVSAACVTRVW